MTRHPALLPIVFTLQDRPHWTVSKTAAGRWRVDGELLQDYCCPVAAANAYLKHKMPCSCGPTEEL